MGTRVDEVLCLGAEKLIVLLCLGDELELELGESGLWRVGGSGGCVGTLWVRPRRGVGSTNSCNPRERGTHWVAGSEGPG